MSARRVALRARLARHVPGVALLAAAAIWLMRRFVFTGGIPAGTDMLGFISRSSQNASFGELLDAWDPGSFGSRRVFSFDNILGALTLLTRNAMATVKLLDLLTLFGTGLAAYALARSWNWSRFVATVAGLLYMTSQASLSRWGSGQLNVEIITALAPVMLLTWSLCLERYSLGRAVGFTLSMGVGILVRADLVLYIVPFLVLYMASVLSARGALRRGLINASRTLAITLPGVLLINAAWLIPSLKGYRAQYETLNQLFSISQLSSRSLDFYSSLLGFGREIGYFAFTGTETWYSFPGLPLWGYYAFATLIPVLAYMALRWNRDRRVVFLVLASVLATLAAPGTRAPVAGLYLWAARNIPVFGNLRDPNRWLIVQAIAYALLASLTIERVARSATEARARHVRQTRSQPLASIATYAVAFAIVATALVPVLPTLLIGLRTWQVTPAQQALLNRLRGTPGQGRVASVPFDQSYRFLVQGSYRGYEHDLGYESPLFTRRPDVALGGWDQRSANFVAYEANLLAQRDSAFVSMLASAGVSRVVSFHYPLVAPQLLAGSVGPYTQQRDISRLPRLAPLLANSAGTDYRIERAAAPLSLRRNIAVVLGGTQGVAALADRPGVNLSDWAAFTADDVIETQGYSKLLTLIHHADIVLLADERPIDIAVEGTRPLVSLAGITSDPQLDRLVTNVPTDQSAQTGSLNDPASPIPQPHSTSSSSTFSVRSSRRIEIWARVMATPLAATIEARVDGVRVGSITPVTLGTGGFEWARIATISVGAGTHRVVLSAMPSRFGDSYEVAESRVLDPGALHSAEYQLNHVLTERAGRVAYSFNLADVAKWAGQSLAERLNPVKAPAYSLHAWAVPTGTSAAVTTVTAPGAAAAPRFRVREGRSVYTIAKILYKKPRDWEGRPYIYLQFKGTDSRKTYQLIFDFGLGQNNEARYSIVDDSRRWKTIGFSTANPGPRSGVTDWSKVRSVRIALASKYEVGTFAVGVPRPSRLVTKLAIPLPILSKTREFGAAARKPACLGGAHPPKTGRFVRRALAMPVSALKASCSIYFESRDGYQQLPATSVKLRRTGTESWSYLLSNRQPGVLVWTQAYDPLWSLSGAGVNGAPLPVLSVLDGYLIRPGRHSGTIAFLGGSSTEAGLVVTFSALLILLLIAALSRRRGRSVRGAPSIATRAYGVRIDRWAAPPPLRRVPAFCLLAGLVLLTSCPLASMAGLTGLLIPLSLTALMAIAVSALLVAVGRPAVPPVGPDPAELSGEQDLHRAAL